MKRLKCLLLLGLVVSCSGCATWAVLNGEQAEFKDVGFRADMPEGWMGYIPAYGFMATRDGYSLNHISVKKIKFLQRLAHTKKRFQTGMLLPEILEVELDSIRSNKEVSYINITKNEPMTIDGQESYRLEYEYEEKNGLKVKVIQCGFVHNDFVYRIVFKAAKLHYYDDTVADFEKFLDSFELLKK